MLYLDIKCKCRVVKHQPDAANTQQVFHALLFPVHVQVREHRGEERTKNKEQRDSVCEERERKTREKGGESVCLERESLENQHEFKFWSLERGREEIEEMRETACVWCEGESGREKEEKQERE